MPCSMTRPATLGCSHHHHRLLLTKYDIFLVSQGSISDRQSSDLSVDAYCLRLIYSNTFRFMKTGGIDESCVGAIVRAGTTRSGGV